MNGNLAIIASLGLFLVSTGCTPSGSGPEIAQRAVETDTPRARESTGRLGHPIGAYLTIEGSVARMVKGGARAGMLWVDTVNGERLESPICIRIDNVRALPMDVRCTFKGYESGRWIGVPRQVLEAEDRPGPQAAWQFQRYFVVTKVLSPEGIELSGR